MPTVQEMPFNSLLETPEHNYYQEHKQIINTRMMQQQKKESSDRNVNQCNQDGNQYKSNLKNENVTWYDSSM